MNSQVQSNEEIKKLTHAQVDKRLWAGHILAKVQNVIRSRGHERQRELQQLELALRLEIGDRQSTKPLYDFIWDNSQSLRTELAARHTLLSENDLFLCACIHAGISIADIADIKGIAPASISMNRYRLKKKLGLLPQEDLETYIHTTSMQI